MSIQLFQTVKKSIYVHVVTQDTTAGEESDYICTYM